MQYESAHKRRDGGISRDGSVALRRALIDLGIGLQLTEPAAKKYDHGLKGRGKPGGVVTCALANRANRIAHALVRDHATHDPARWARHPTRPTRKRFNQNPSQPPSLDAALSGRDEGPDRMP